MNNSSEGRIEPSHSTSSVSQDINSDADLLPDFRIENWPIDSVLVRLADAVDHLLRDHNCDMHGYEGLSYAVFAARYHTRAHTPAVGEQKHVSEGCLCFDNGVLFERDPRCEVVGDAQQARESIREAIISVIEAGWRCSADCALQHPWTFAPPAFSDLDSEEAERRNRFVNAVHDRITTALQAAAAERDTVQSLADMRRKQITEMMSECARLAKAIEDDPPSTTYITPLIDITIWKLEKLESAATSAREAERLRIATAINNVPFAAVIGNGLGALKREVLAAIEE